MQRKVYKTFFVRFRFESRLESYALNASESYMHFSVNFFVHLCVHSNSHFVLIVKLCFPFLIG